MEIVSKWQAAALLRSQLAYPQLCRFNAYRTNFMMHAITLKLLQIDASTAAQVAWNAGAYVRVHDLHTVSLAGVQPVLQAARAAIDALEREAAEPIEKDCCG